jgi:hypothetical protein
MCPKSVTSLGHPMILLNNIVDKTRLERQMIEVCGHFWMTAWHSICVAKVIQHIYCLPKWWPAQSLATWHDVTWRGPTDWLQSCGECWECRHVLLLMLYNNHILGYFQLKNKISTGVYITNPTWVGCKRVDCHPRVGFWQFFTRLAEWKMSKSNPRVTIFPLTAIPCRILFLPS